MASIAESYTHTGRVWQNQLLAAAILMPAVFILPGCAAKRQSVAIGTASSVSRPLENRIDAITEPLQSAQPIHQFSFLAQVENEPSSQEAPVGTGDIGEKVEILDAKRRPRLVAIEPPRIDQPHNLKSLIAQAVATHPSIEAARQKVAAACNRIPQAVALDDPVVGNTFWPFHDQALQTAGGRVGHQFALTQKVPWPTKLDARGLVALREVQVARAEAAKVEREIVEAVRLAYYELWLAEQLIEIIDDNRELARDLISVAEARYKTGGSQRDVLQAELEVDKLDEQLISLRRQREQARADLGTLVRQPVHLMPSTYNELNAVDEAPQLEILVATAEESSPALQGLAAEIARDRAKENLACLQQYPDFQIGLGYSIISDNNAISPVANGRDNINFSVGVTLPIWRDKIDAGIREAAHQRNSTVNRREATRDRLRGQLRRQVAAAYAAGEQLELFRDRLVPRTEQTLEITTADYQGSKADFTDLIGIYRDLLSYQVQVARTKATLASTLAQIERTVGCAIAFHPTAN